MQRRPALPLVAVHCLIALLFVVTQALLSNMESMFSSPDLQLPSCDVRDVARAHILAAEVPTASGRRAPFMQRTHRHLNNSAA